MTINCVWEHNGRDTLLYAVDLWVHTPAEKHWKPLSGKCKQKYALISMVRQKAVTSMDIVIIEEKVSELAICDADSDVLFESEKHR